jgi:streptomycin 6-kinase
VILPQSFVHTIQNTFGRRGRDWLKTLPDLIAEGARHWELTDIQPVPDLSYNFVAFAGQGNEEVILKIGVPDRELVSEMATLRLFNGQGAAHMLQADLGQGMFVLERLKPGDRLVALEDDQQATQIAADVMLKLWQPALLEKSLIKLSDWFKGFHRLRSRFHGGTGPLDQKLVEEAEGAVKDFFAEDYEPMLIHGDLHHFNILLSARGWLAIDPKGVIGPAAYEVGPLLINPRDKLLSDSNPEVRMKKRIDILSERLGFERQRIRLWGLAHAVLSAWWNLEDNENWKNDMACAAIFASL